MKQFGRVLVSWNFFVWFWGFFVWLVLVVVGLFWNTWRAQVPHNHSTTFKLLLSPSCYLWNCIPMLVFPAVLLSLCKSQWKWSENEEQLWNMTQIMFVCLLSLKNREEHLKIRRDKASHDSRKVWLCCHLKSHFKGHVCVLNETWGWTLCSAR